MVSRIKDAALDIGAAQFDRVRDVVTQRLDRTYEQLSRVSGPMRDLGLNPARKLTKFYCPLDSVRAVSLGLLDKTEAILDSLDSLAAERCLAEHLAERLDRVTLVDFHGGEDSCDETSSSTSRSTWSWVDSVPRVLPVHVIRTFGLQISRSATLKVTGLCLHDTCAAVMRRLRVKDAQKLLDRLVLDDVKQQLMSAAKDRSAVAAATLAARVAYIGFERLLGDSIATRLLARATGKPGASPGLRECMVGKDVVLEMLDDPNVSDSSPHEHAAACAAGEREVRQGAPVEFRLIVKNSFIELDETPGDLRRARSWPDESWDTMRTQTLPGLTSGPFTLVGTWEPLPDAVTSAPSHMPLLSAAHVGAAGSREGLAEEQVMDDLGTISSSSTSASPNLAADSASTCTAHVPAILIGDSPSCVTPAANVQTEVSTSAPELSEPRDLARFPPTPAVASSTREGKAGAKDHNEIDMTLFDSDENRTTVMLRNIPREYSPAMVLDLMDNAGFSRRYNFFYLPVDFTRGVVLGYALVCCRSPADAAELLEWFQGFRRWAVPSSCICEASWSQPRQSLRDHIERYRSSPVMHPSVPDEYKPALFVDGKRVPFPAPTKAIRRPRVRHVRSAG